MERTAQLETLLREKEELEKVVLQPKPVMVSARRGRLVLKPVKRRQLAARTFSTVHHESPAELKISLLGAASKTDIQDTLTDRLERSTEEISRQPAAMKKVTPAEIKAKLGKAKLRDLRSEGDKLRAESVQKRVNVVQSPVKPDILLDISLPTPSPHTRVKCAAARARARNHSLSQPVNGILPLPLIYARLQEVFRSTDTIISMMFNRKERIMLEKLASHTTTLMNKKWNVTMLQKILVVFPQAYNLRWRTRQDDPKTLEMVVEPNMNYKRDLKNLFDNEETEARLMNVKPLVERRDMFRNGLVEIVKDYHASYLASLDPPIEVERSKLTKWHKDFDVDLVPDLDLAELPPKPRNIPPVTPCKNPELFSVNSRLDQNVNRSLASKSLQYTAHHLHS